MVSSEYRRRRPEETVLYRAVRDHLATFLDVAARRSGMTGLPTYVRQEFERYLDCGILANGFARVRCPGCGHDEVVAFSCKGRGFCPSCMGRRMADTAAHLVDHVFPEVPIRQWVLSFPYGVRLHFVRDPQLLSQAITIFMEEVSRHYERELIYAKEGLEPDEWRSQRSLPFREEAVGGAVTSVQRYGSSLNLHPHLHSLVLDGVYWREAGTSRVRFFEAPAPSKEALEELVGRVAERINRRLVRKGLLIEGSREEGGAIAAEPSDPSLLDVVQGASIQGLVGLASRWKRVEAEGRVKGLPWVSAGEKPFTAEEDGYTIHAGVELSGKDRGKLEKVCRYILRPAFAEERLRERGDGRIEYELRKPRWDGARSIVLDPVELLACPP
ncbi:MAG: transposase [Planctomycetes bacterium]|nr:transposase [Planctomycetota bacterium]